jgi:hypothetical protein
MHRTGFRVQADIPYHGVFLESSESIHAVGFLGGMLGTVRDTARDGDGTSDDHAREPPRAFQGARRPPTSCGPASCRRPGCIPVRPPVPGEAGTRSPLRSRRSTPRGSGSLLPAAVRVRRWSRRCRGKGAAPVAGSVLAGVEVRWPPRSSAWAHATGARRPAPAAIFARGVRRRRHAGVPRLL